MPNKPAKKKAPVKTNKKAAKTGLHPRSLGGTAPSIGKDGGGDMSRKEVVALDRAAQQQKRAEQAWQTLTGAIPAEDDSWSKVEEKLIKKPEESAHSERRWKYFSK